MVAAIIINNLFKEKKKVSGSVEALMPLKNWAWKKFGNKDYGNLKWGVGKKGGFWKGVWFVLERYPK